MFAPRLEWRGPVPAHLSLGNGTRTRRELEAFVLGFHEVFGLDTLTVRRLIVDDEDAMVIGSARCRVRATNARFVLDFAVSLAVRDGMVEACWVVPDTLAAAVALRRVAVL